MKRLLSIIVTILVLFGCEEAQPVQEAMITLDAEQKTDLLISSDGGSFDVCFISALEWNAEVEYDSGGDKWISLNQVKGNGGYAIAHIKADVQENQKSEKRSAKVVVRSGDETATITVNQAAYEEYFEEPVFRLMDKGTEVGASGGRIQVEVEFNVEYSYEINAGWIREVEIRSVDSKVHTFEIAENTSEESRVGIISFCGNSNCIPFTVTQIAAEPKPHLDIDVESVLVPVAGRTVEVNIISNVAWEVRSEADWLTFSRVSGDGDGAIEIKASANETTEIRSAVVTVSSVDDAIVRSIVVIQEAEPKVFELKDKFADVSAVGGTIYVTVRHNVDYRCEISADWIREIETRTVSENLHAFEISANSSEESRSAVISFIGNGETIPFTVEQDACVSDSYLELNTSGWSGLSADYDGDPLVVEVYSNTDWMIEDVADWVIIDPVSGSGNGSFSVTVSKNESIITRETSFTVRTSDGSVRRVFSVNQKGAEPYFRLDSQSAEVKAEGGKVAVTVIANIEYSYEIPVEWIKEVDAVGNVHTFEIEANEDISQRRATISFCGNGNCLPFIITQAGKIPQNVLEVDRKDISVPASGTDAPLKVNVTSDISWNVESDSGWCMVTPSSGINNGAFNVTVGKNASSEPRVALITVSSSDGFASREIAVIQAPASSDTEDDSWQNEEFIHKSLALRFTADWCGYCPQMATALKNAQKELPDKIEAISVHGGGSGLASEASDALTNYYGIGAFPTGLVDGWIWLQNSGIATTTQNVVNAVKNTESKYGVVTGASWKSTISGNQILLNLSLYIKEPGSYKVTALAVEDGVVSYQADYNAGSSGSYVHDAIIRDSFTDVTGDPFTVSSGAEQKDFNYSVGLPSGCNVENLRVVVYVQKKDSGSFVIDNAASAKVGVVKHLSVKSGNWGSGNEGVVPGDDINL